MALDDTVAVDGKLLGLLREGGSDLTLGELIALIEGVEASPAAADDEGWMRLVAPSPSPALTAGLYRLRRSIREARRPAPAPSAAERLAALRAALAAARVHGFLVPRADEHQGEYVPRAAERLRWLTGFGGSAGLAVVLADRAAIFTDGRYTLQVRQQVDTGLYETRHLIEEPPGEWIARYLGDGRVLGYDPWLHTIDQVDRLRAAAEKAGGELQPLANNPIDRVWTGRPPPPVSPVLPHDESFAGEGSAAKRARIAEILAGDGHDAVALSAPDSIAWLLNIRGGDVPRTPLPLSFAVLHRRGDLDLYIDERKLPAATRRHLGNAVTVRPRAALGGELAELAASGATIRLDGASCPAWIADRIRWAGGRMVRDGDPVQLPKACKNEVELAGMRRAHRRDGAAVTRFLRWLARDAPAGRLTEQEAARKLLALRAEGEHFRDLSFDTISGAGPNGAIIHYRVSEDSNRRLRPGELYLVDSGAQYLDGTTDITRTVAIGPAGPEQRDRFTRVLKSHIAIAMARFPVGATGAQLDPLARAPLWEAGLDFDHGTGHGVGSYLSVHEGPQRISKAGAGVALQPGMVISNEPGYYRPGAYGIRIENLVVVQETEIEGGDRPFLCFETITLAPIDRALIEPGLLTGRELAWLNDYHRRVRDSLTPLLDDDDAAWLAGATAPIAAPPQNP